MTDTPADDKPSGAVCCLMVLVIAILVGIPAAVLLPSYYPCGTGERYNEGSAIYQLKSYCIAQVTFNIGMQGRHPGNNAAGKDPKAYADNYRNLFYGWVFNEDAEKGGDGKDLRLRLLDKCTADAFLIDNALSGAPTPPEAPAVPAPYKGYFFCEDLNHRRSDETAEFPAFMAFPERYGETGSRVFWIGQEGTVYAHDPKLPKGTPAHETARRYFSPTPAGGSLPPGWEAM